MEFSIQKKLYQENYQRAIEASSHNSPALSTIAAINKYDIVFKGVIFDYHSSLGKINEIEKNPLTIEINEGEKILLLEKNDIAREYLVYAFTRNLPQFRRESVDGEGTIEIGGKKINDLTIDGIF